MIRVTELAKKKVLEAQTSEGRLGNGLRVLVRNGGTPQVEYALHFVEPGAELPGDRVVEAGELRLLVDAMSAPFLESATLDYVEGPVESGFKVEAPNAGPRPPDGPLAEAVQRVIEEKVNPSVASHGGWVALVEVRDDTAYLRMGGGCQGCGMAGMTLRRGIETMIREAVPEIRRIEDVTDHAGGTTPYYPSST